MEWLLLKDGNEMFTRCFALGSKGRRGVALDIAYITYIHACAVQKMRCRCFYCCRTAVPLPVSLSKFLMVGRRVIVYFCSLSLF